ncbi:MAG: hypothetical protein U5K00_00425 [Melioribacteraceae bacterium]|nr:hypothetical protein [Melioribacteraceae bacterium]
MEITDSSQTKPYSYGISFIDASTIDILNLTTGETVGRAGLGYPSGGRTFVLSSEGFNITLSDDLSNPIDLLPEAGDRITINFAVSVTRNNQDTVIVKRPIQLKQKQAMSDGVIFSLVPPKIINDIARIGGTDNIDITFSVDDNSLIKTETYIISTTGNGTDENGEGFINLLIRNYNG